MKKIYCLVALAILVSSSAIAQTYPPYNPFPEGTGYIDSTGRDWIPVPNPDLSWNTLASQCDPITGYCNQSFMGTGVYWASQSDLTSIIYDITGMPAGALASGNTLFPETDAYAEEVMDKLGITFTLGEFYPWVLDGLTRDAPGSEYAIFSPREFGNPVPGASDQFVSETPLPAVAEPEIGAYFYRVPEPDAAGLFAGALLVAGFASRRRR